MLVREFDELMKRLTDEQKRQRVEEIDRWLSHQEAQESRHVLKDFAPDAE